MIYWEKILNYIKQEFYFSIYFPTILFFKYLMLVAMSLKVIRDLVRNKNDII